MSRRGHKIENREERDFLLLSKEAKRLVQERMKEVNINTYTLEHFLKYRNGLIASWFAYQVTLFVKKKVNIQLSQLYELFDCLGIYFITQGKKNIFIKLPLNCCCIDYSTKRNIPDA